MTEHQYTNRTDADRPPGAKSLRERRKDDTRAEIVEAGMLVFRRRGFQAATVEEIARAAHISRGTYYLHFTDKSDLAVAIGTQGIGDQTQAFRELAESSDWSEAAVRAWLRSFEKVWKKHRASIALGFRASIASSKFLEKDSQIWEGFLEAMRPVWEPLAPELHEPVKTRLFTLILQLTITFYEMIERRAPRLGEGPTLDALSVFWHRELEYCRAQRP